MRIPNLSKLCVWLVAVAAIAGAARAADEAENSRRSSKYPDEVLKEAAIRPRFGEKIPLDTKFVDADGKTVRIGDLLQDRPVILHLVYYDCPMLCKLSSDGLFSTLGVLPLKPGEDFTIITLSFDPSEGPELSASARKMAMSRVGPELVEKGWHFLTGDEASITAITDAVGFRYVYDEGTKQYAHAAGLFVLTPDGTLSRYLGGINYAPRDVRLSLVEASEGKIGTFADQVMMLCYMYDPSVGRYGVAIMTILRTAGVLTVCTMAAAISLMVRRERQRTRLAESAASPYDDALAMNWKSGD